MGSNDRHDMHTPDDDDDDAVELTCDGILTSPDRDKMKDEMDGVHNGKELEELLAVESTAQACIMHALHIDQSSVGIQGSGEVQSEQKPVIVPITNGELSAQE